MTMTLKAPVCSILLLCAALVAPTLVLSDTSPGSVPSQADEATRSIGSDPLAVDPLLGLEIETMRRMLNEALSRIEILENRMRELDAGSPGAQIPLIEGQ